ncbi:hypothetical protein CBR_g71220 [Chara braunii]|uniref:Uncharacterized protein n=2 Tax=Chara braunii TaxID=69332 RepID=A0A388MFX9_CHABU|nr:hypothetical protein CBR_g71220 [Chara braunii]|eukprot:GBG93477.1 hypothetical protein CBR_g71220 [Chara braunii]
MFGGYDRGAMPLPFFVPLAPGHDEAVHVTDFLETWASSVPSGSAMDVGTGTSISGPVRFAGGECFKRCTGGQGGLPTSPPDKEVGMLDDSEDDHLRAPLKPGLQRSRRQGLFGEATPHGGGVGKQLQQASGSTTPRRLVEKIGEFVRGRKVAEVSSGDRAGSSQVREVRGADETTRWARPAPAQLHTEASLQREAGGNVAGEEEVFEMGFFREKTPEMTQSGGKRNLPVEEEREGVDALKRQRKEKGSALTPMSREGGSVEKRKRVGGGDETPKDSLTRRRTGESSGKRSKSSSEKKADEGESGEGDDDVDINLNAFNLDNAFFLEMKTGVQRDVHNARAAMKVKDHPVFNYYNFCECPFRPIYFPDDEFDGYAHVSSEDNMKDKKNPPRLQILSMRDIRNIWKIKGKPRVVLNNTSKKKEEVRTWVQFMALAMKKTPYTPLWNLSTEENKKKEWAEKLRYYLPLAMADDSVFALGEKFYDEWSRGKLLASDGRRWTEKPPTHEEVAKPGLSTVTNSQGLKKHVWYVKVDDPLLKKGRGKAKKGVEEKTYYVQIPEPDVHCWKELADLTDREKRRLLNGPRLLTHPVYKGAVAEDDAAALRRKQKVTPTDVEEKSFKSLTFSDFGNLSQRGVVYKEGERNPNQLCNQLFFFCGLADAVLSLGKPHAQVVWSLLQQGRHVLAVDGDTTQLEYTVQFVTHQVSSGAFACDFHHVVVEPVYDMNKDMFFKLTPKKRRQVYSFLVGHQPRFRFDEQYVMRKQVAIVVLQGYHGASRVGAVNFIKRLEYVFFDEGVDDPDDFTLKNYKLAFGEKDDFNIETEQEESVEDDLFDLDGQLAIFNAQVFESPSVCKPGTPLGTPTSGGPTPVSSSAPVKRGGLSRLRSSPGDSLRLTPQPERLKPGQPVPQDHPHLLAPERPYHMGDKHTFSAAEDWGHDVVWHPDHFQPVLLDGEWAVAVRDVSGGWVYDERWDLEAFKAHAYDAVLERLSEVNRRRKDDPALRAYGDTLLEFLQSNKWLEVSSAFYNLPSSPSINQVSWELPGITPRSEVVKRKSRGKEDEGDG